MSFYLKKKVQRAMPKETPMPKETTLPSELRLLGDAAEGGLLSTCDCLLG